MLFTRQSLYRLQWNVEGALESAFPLEAYSKYKYGDAAAAEQFGLALAKMAARTLPHIFKEEKLYVAASAYKVVPTAAEQIARSFTAYLNILRKKLGLPPMQLLHLQRETVFSGDYGKLQRAEREALMRKNSIHLPEGLAQKRMILLDDVRITGSHEQKLVHLLEAADVHRADKLYIAELEGDTAANIEHQLNHYWMQSPAQLLQLAQEDHWNINARVCKYVLSLETEALVAFLAELPTEKTTAIWKAIQADGYDTMEDYRQNAQLLAAQVDHEYANI